MKALAVIAALIVSTPTAPAAAKSRHITSAYTSIAPHDCKTVKESPKDWQGEPFMRQQCPGYASIPVFVEDMDLRTTVSAGSAGGYSCLVTNGCGFNSAGDTIEWRLANGKPFAIIYRISSDYTDDDGKEVKTPYLVVDTFKSGDRPACRIAEIPGGKSNANGLARAAADRTLTGKVKCLRAH